MLGLKAALDKAGITEEMWRKTHGPSKARATEIPISQMIDADGTSGEDEWMGHHHDPHAEANIIAREHADEIKTLAIEFFRGLDFRDAFVFYMRYAHSNKQLDIADMVGRTEARIFQITTALAITREKRVNSMLLKGGCFTYTNCRQYDAYERRSSNRITRKLQSYFI